MNADDQMERDWRADQRASSKMRDAHLALNDALEDERVQSRLGKHAELLRTAQVQLEEACAQIVRTWD